MASIYADTYKPMQAKTAEKLIANKFKKFLDTIEDETVREKVRHNTIITGGCIASMLTGNPVNDYDMYFRDAETAEMIANYYVGKFLESPTQEFMDAHKDYYSGNTSKDDKIDTPIRVDKYEDRVKIVVKSAGVVSTESDQMSYEYFEDDETGERTENYVNTVTSALDKGKTKHNGKHVPIFITSNAITLSDRVQLIVRFYGDPATIHENYDFVHCTNYWDSATGKLVTNKDALLALMSRTLFYVGSLYPICSLFRMRKFLDRGYTISAGQILKICYQVNNLDLTDHSVLEEQLIGVDMAYFQELISMLRDAKARNKTIDQAYVVSLIDQIFEGTTENDLDTPTEDDV